MKSISNWEPVIFTFLGSCLGRLLSGCSEPRPYTLRAGSLGMGGGPPRHVERGRDSQKRLRRCRSVARVRPVSQRQRRYGGSV